MFSRSLGSITLGLQKSSPFSVPVRFCKASIIEASRAAIGLCKEGKPKQAETILSAYKQKGVKVGVSLYNAIIYTYCQKDEVKDATRILHNLMEDPEIEPNTLSFDTLISVLREDSDYFYINNYMKYMKKNMIEINSNIFNNLIVYYAKNDRAKQAYKVMEVLLKKETPSLSSFTAIIPILNPVKQDSTILQYIHIMRKENMPVTKIFYQKVLENFANNHNMVSAEAVVELMKKDGFPMTIETVNSLLSGYKKTQNNQTISGLISSLPKLGLNPDTNTCALLFPLYAKAGKGRLAMNLFEEMKKQKITLSSNSFVNLLTANMQIRANFIALCSEIKISGVKPDARLCDLILRGYAKYDELDLMVSFMKTIKKSGIEISPKIRALVIQKHVDCGKIDVAVSLLDEMSTPPADVYHMVVDAHVKQKNIKQIEVILAKMNSDGVVLDPETLLNVFKVFLDMNQEDSALGMLNKMQEPTFDIANIMLTHFISKNNINSVLEIFQLMKQHQIDQPSVFHQLIHFYRNRDDFGKIQAIIKQMDGRGIKLTEKAYNDAIACAASNKKQLKIFGYVERMKAEKLKPSIDIFNSLIDVLCKEGNIRGAWVYFHELLATKKKPTPQTFHPLIKFYVEKNQHAKAENILTQMKKHSIPITEETLFLIYPPEE